MAEWPTRSFEDEGSEDGKVSTNSKDMGSKGNPPSTADIPDTSEVTVEHHGEGFNPRNS